MYLNNEIDCNLEYFTTSIILRVFFFCLNSKSLEARFDNVFQGSCDIIGVSQVHMQLSANALGMSILASKENEA